MFFRTRKKAKLEEARRQAEQYLREEEERKRKEFADAFVYNKIMFNNICHMVRSLPKERHIVVVQRENIFWTKYDRNWAYFELAKRLHFQHQSTGQTWITLSSIDCDEDALYAFYEPKTLTPEFERALENFSKDGYRIQRIRYYSEKL